MNVDWMGGRVLGSSSCEYAYAREPTSATMSATGTATNTHQKRRKKPLFGFSSFPFFPRVCLGVYERPREPCGAVSVATDLRILARALGAMPGRRVAFLCGSEGVQTAAVRLAVNASWRWFHRQERHT